VRQGDAAALAATVAALAVRSAEARDAMGRLGRAYDRDRLIEKLESWLQTLRVPASHRPFQLAAPADGW
jgi:hypothetical protein